MSAPYRDKPSDRPKVGPTPRAFCPHCKYTATHNDYCYPPQSKSNEFDYTKAVGAESEINNRKMLNGTGGCPHYEPSRWTRLYRLVGLRKPVVR